MYARVTEAKDDSFFFTLTCHDKCPYVSFGIKVDPYADSFHNQAWKENFEYELYSLRYEKSSSYAKGLATEAYEDCYNDLN